MLVVALVVVIVNAQLTWWIVYSLRENRVRLRLERERLVAACEGVTSRIDLQLGGARAALLEALAQGSALGRDPAPAPFTVWSGAAGPCAPAWSQTGPLISLHLPLGGVCVTAAADRAWSAKLLELPAELELVAGAAPSAPGAPTIPVIALQPPFAGTLIRPHPVLWEQILRGYRGRIVMMVSEGSFFALLLLVIVGLLAKTLRREVELERQHRNFLAAITHELKSPLAAMRLSLETVLRGRADGTASVRFLENALQDTERLQSLVQKVLEVTRYTGTVGGLKLRRSCLSEVIEESLGTFRRRATAAGADLDIDIAPEVWAEVDEEAFAIVVSNLLENAVKYGGTIPRVRVGLAVSDGSAILEVGDNGRGIKPDDLPFIFNRFFRGGDEMTRTTQGTGLGLFLVREIVTAHRGAVEVAATGPGGTTFKVTLHGAEAMEGQA